MIEIADLAFGFAPAGFRLDVPALSVGQGEKVAVIGPSGSGKTTFLHLIAGIHTPERGRIEISGTDVAKLSDPARRAFRARQIGLVFQDFGLIDYLSGLDNILHPYRISAALALNAEVRKRAEALARATGLGGQLRRRPGQLSQGEKQRLAICRALLPRPALILADEPTGNLDPDTKEAVLSVLLDRAEAEGSTVLAVTHDHALLPSFDRVVDFRDFRTSAAA